MNFSLLSQVHLKLQLSHITIYSLNLGIEEHIKPLLIYVLLYIVCDLGFLLSISWVDVTGPAKINHVSTNYTEY